MNTKFTIVQHSAMAYKGDTDFRHGLEEYFIRTKREENKVLKAGGIIFDSYIEASDFCMKAMYPNESDGLIPEAKGIFSESDLNGLKIYIPIREIIG